MFSFHNIASLDFNVKLNHKVVLNLGIFGKFLILFNSIKLEIYFYGPSDHSLINEKFYFTLSLDLRRTLHYFLKIFFNVDYFFKVSVKFVTILLLLYALIFCLQACRILAP